MTKKNSGYVDIDNKHIAIGIVLVFIVYFIIANPILTGIIIVITLLLGIVYSFRTLIIELITLKWLR